MLQFLIPNIQSMTVDFSMSCLQRGKISFASPQLPRRSMSPSTRRTNESRKKILSLDSNVLSKNGDDMKNTEGSSTISTGISADGKFENISDNGSEISDEGYRSLGLVQQANNSQSKRTSLHSQNSIEDGQADDAKINGMNYEEAHAHAECFNKHSQESVFNSLNS